MKSKETKRGFKLYEFNDSNNIKCNVQKSSSAEEPKIWLGSENIGLQEFKAYQGWINRDEFDKIDTLEHHFIANNRMHLNIKQVKALLPILQKFVETGEI